MRFERTQDCALPSNITLNDEIDASELLPTGLDDADFIELENMFVARAGINYNF